MTTRYFGRKIAMLATAACVGSVQCVLCADAQEVSPSSEILSRSIASNSRANLNAFLAALTQRHQVRFVLDPELEAPAEILKPDQSASLTTALNSLPRRMKSAVWQRVFLKRDAGLPSPEKLAAAVRALDRLPSAELLAENPLKGRSTLLLALPRSRASEAQAEIDLLDTQPVYVLYNTALPADGKTVLERIADRQQQQLSLLAQLPLDQRPNPAQLGQRVMQSLDGSGRDAALRAVGEAGMAAWQNTDPEVRDAMMQHFIKTVQSSASRKPGAGANAETIEQAPKNYSETLRVIVVALAKRYHAHILIDPALVTVLTPPTRPSEALTLAQALDVLTHSVPASRWRGLYQKQPTPTTSAALSARNLTVLLRTLDALPPVLLQFENTVSHRSITLQTDIAATALPATRTAHAFAAYPTTYLIYSHHDAADSALPSAQRLEQMQVEQMNQLLTLTPDQMNQAMTEALAQYSNGTGETPGQMMHLPIMALLMGAWFPQKAKEH